MTAPTTNVKDILLAVPGTAVFAKPSTAPVDTWGLFIGKQPDDNSGIFDRSITLYDTGGASPLPHLALDYPHVMINVRGKPEQYTATREKAVALKNILLGLPSRDINGDRIVSVTLNGDINFVGYDDRNRPEFTLNFRLIVEPDATGSNRQPL